MSSTPSTAPFNPSPVECMMALCSVPQDLASDLISCEGSLLQALGTFYQDEGMLAGTILTNTDRRATDRYFEDDEGAWDIPLEILLEDTTTIEFEAQRRRAHRELDNFNVRITEGGTLSQYYLDILSSEQTDEQAIAQSFPMPLHSLQLTASRSGRVDQLMILHSQSWIDPFFRDDRRRSVFHFASWKGSSVETFEYYLNYGLSIDSEFTLRFLQFRDVLGYTPLRYAVMSSSIDVVKLILNTLKFNSIPLKENPNLVPLLTEAAGNSSAPLIRLLLSDPNIRIEPDLGYPAALFAAAHLDYECLRLLLDARPEFISDVSTMQDSHNKTCIMFICQNGLPETNFFPMADLCFEHGADLFHVDEVGRSCLWFAAWTTRFRGVPCIDVAHWCLDHGMCPDFLRLRDFSRGFRSPLDLIDELEDEEARRPWMELFESLGWEGPLEDIPRISYPPSLYRNNLSIEEVKGVLEYVEPADPEEVERVEFAIEMVEVRVERGGAKVRIDGDDGRASVVWKSMLLL